MRLIDADALIELIPKTSQSKFENCWTCKLLSAEAVKEIINSAPTIEPKRGEWIAKYEGSYLQRRMYCSVCGKKSGIGGIESNQRKPYCPNCGAKMDGEREGER